MWADVTVFDPARIADRATYEQPQQYALGVQYVLVNGQAVIDGGRHMGRRPGAILYGPGSAGMVKPNLRAHLTTGQNLPRTTSRQIWNGIRRPMIRMCYTVCIVIVEALLLGIEFKLAAAEAVTDVREMAKVGGEASDVNLSMQFLIFAGADGRQKVSKVLSKTVVLGLFGLDQLRRITLENAIAIAVE